MAKKNSLVDDYVLLVPICGIELRDFLVQRMYLKEVFFVGELIQLAKEDFVSRMGFSEEAIEEIARALEKRGLSFGMKLSSGQRMIVSDANGWPYDSYLPKGVHRPHLVWRAEFGRVVPVTIHVGETILTSYTCEGCKKPLWHEQGSRETECPNCKFGGRSMVHGGSRNPAVPNSERAYDGGTFYKGEF